MQAEGLQASATDDESDGALVLTFVGEIDMGSAAIVSDMIEAALQEQRPAVMVDLHDVTFIDSQGVTALVQARQASEQAGARLALRNPSRQVLDVLRITGLDTVFDVERS